MVSLTVPTVSWTASVTESIFSATAAVAPRMVPSTCCSRVSSFSLKDERVWSICSRISSVVSVIRYLLERKTRSLLAPRFPTIAQRGLACPGSGKQDGAHQHAHAQRAENCGHRIAPDKDHGIGMDYL